MSQNMWSNVCGVTKNGTLVHDHSDCEAINARTLKLER